MCCQGGYWWAEIEFATVLSFESSAEAAVTAARKARVSYSVCSEVAGAVRSGRVSTFQTVLMLEPSHQGACNL